MATASRKPDTACPLKRLDRTCSLSPPVNPFLGQPTGIDGVMSHSQLFETTQAPSTPYTLLPDFISRRPSPVIETAERLPSAIASTASVEITRVQRSQTNSELHASYVDLDSTQDKGLNTPTRGTAGGFGYDDGKTGRKPNTISISTDVSDLHRVEDGYRGRVYCNTPKEAPMRTVLHSNPSVLSDSLPSLREILEARSPLPTSNILLHSSSPLSRLGKAKTCLAQFGDELGLSPPIYDSRTVVKCEATSITSYIWLIRHQADMKLTCFQEMPWVIYSLAIPS